MKYRTKQTASKMLQRFFKNSPEADSLTLEQIYIASNRDLTKPVQNKNWLSNKLTHIRYHNLVSPTYSINNGKRVLTGIELTMDGKKALGRIEGISPFAKLEKDIKRSFYEATPVQHNNREDLMSLMRAVARLREQNPEYEIVFDVKLKNPGGDSTHTPGV